MSTVRAAALVAKRHNTALFQPLTFTAQAGDYVEITGANGSGKTTLLRILAGLYDQFSGEYECDGVMYSGHRLGLDPLLSAIENLAWLHHLEDTTPTDEKMLQALSRVGMAPLGLQAVGQMSQGQQRRVRMAHWLLSQATVWLLDEPLNALDTEGRDLVAALIDEHLNVGGVVVCATHLGVNVGQQSMSIALEPILA